MVTLDLSDEQRELLRNNRSLQVVVTIGSKEWIELNELYPNEDVLWRHGSLTSCFKYKSREKQANDTEMFYFS